MTNTQIGHFEQLVYISKDLEVTTDSRQDYVIELGLSSEPGKLQHEKVTILIHHRKKELHLIK